MRQSESETVPVVALRHGDMGFFLNSTGDMKTILKSTGEFEK